MGTLTPQDIEAALDVLRKNFQGYAFAFNRSFQRFSVKDDATGKPLSPDQFPVSQDDMLSVLAGVVSQRVAQEAATGAVSQSNPFHSFSRSPVGRFMMNHVVPRGHRQQAAGLLQGIGGAYNNLPDTHRQLIQNAGGSLASGFSRFLPSSVSNAANVSTQVPSGLIGSMGGKIGDSIIGIGGKFGLSAGASMGIAGAGVAGIGVEAMRHNVSAMSNSGRSAAESLIGGIRSAYGEIAHVGKELVGILTSNLLSPMGKSGHAIGGLVGGGVNGLIGAGGAVLNGAAGIAGAAGGIAGGAAGIGLGIAGVAGGALIGSIVPGLGTLIGAAVGGVIMTTLGMIVAAGLAMFTKLLSGVVSMIGKVAGAIGKVLVEGIKASIEIIKDAFDTLTKFASNALSITMKSGMPIGQAANATLYGRALGMSDSDMSQMYGRNTIFQSMNANIMGMHGANGSVEQDRSFRDSYRSMMVASGAKIGRNGDITGGNPMMANMMANQTGFGAMIPLAYMSDKLFDHIITSVTKMIKAFGFSDGTLKEAAQDFQLLQTQMTMFFDMVKMKFAAELLPFAERAIGGVTDYLQSHSGDISKWIKAGVHYLIVDLPLALIHFSAGILRITQTIMETVGNFLLAMAGALPGIGDFFENISNRARNFAASVDLVKHPSNAVQDLKIIAETNAMIGKQNVPQWAVDASRAMYKAGHELTPRSATDHSHELKYYEKVHNGEKALQVLFGEQKKRGEDFYLASIAESSAKTAKAAEKTADKNTGAEVSDAMAKLIGASVYFSAQEAFFSAARS